MLDPAELLQVNMEPRWNHLDLLRLFHVVRWADDWTGRKFGSRVHGRTPCRSRWSLPLRGRDTLDFGSDNLSQSRLDTGSRNCFEPVDSSISGLSQRVDTRYQQNTFHFQRKQLSSTRRMEAILVGFSGVHRR